MSVPLTSARWMASRGERDTVAVAFIGKVKTASQMTSLLLLLLAYPGSGGSKVGDCAFISDRDCFSSGRGVHEELSMLLMRDIELFPDLARH